MCDTALLKKIWNFYAIIIYQNHIVYHDSYKNSNISHLVILDLFYDSSMNNYNNKQTLGW